MWVNDEAHYRKCEGLEFSSSWCTADVCISCKQEESTFSPKSRFANLQYHHNISSFSIGHFYYISLTIIQSNWSSSKVSLKAFKKTHQEIYPDQYSLLQLDHPRSKVGCLQCHNLTSPDFVKLLHSGVSVSHFLSWPVITWEMKNNNFTSPCKEDH